nr:EOG090X0BHG [Cyclestheria hislopi]
MFHQSKFLFIKCVVFLQLSFVNGWDQSELEIFDLVEEVNQNFYEVLGVPENCSQGEIKKAYRKLSLQLHPDKNDASDAEEKFRQLVGIYEVLRDEVKRAKYNRVLVEGLPNWRQPLYYYRRVRKMGMLELSVWLFVLFTIGQYAVAWGAYFEKKLAVEKLLSSKLKKLKKKKKKQEIDVKGEVDRVLVKPSFKNTLPFQIFNFIISIPNICKQIKLVIEEKRKERQEEEERRRKEEEELQRQKEEMEKEKQRKNVKRKRIIPIPERSGEDDGCILVSVDDPNSQPPAPEKVVPKFSGGLWTDDDLADLAKYMKKYPAGTPERWEKIAEALNRTVFEVTHFAKKVKENAYRPPNEEESSEIPQEKIEKKKEKTRGGKLGKIDISDKENGTEVDRSVNNVWTQKQQKALEIALAQYPKGCLERWERIAKAVPDKTKEECMLRVKQLAEMVKKKKQMEENQLQEVKKEQVSEGHCNIEESEDTESDTNQGFE